jgi:hypothetical protein
VAFGCLSFKVLGIFLDMGKGIFTGLVNRSRKITVFSEKIAKAFGKHIICKDLKNAKPQKMKNEKTIILAIAVYAAAMIMIFNIIGANAQERDPVKSANAANEKKLIKILSMKTKPIFWLSLPMPQMMDTQGGETQKGTSSKIREYEQIMVRDKSDKKRNYYASSGE